MVTYYCSVADVSDFLRVPITATTTPNKTQVEKIINRKEEEIERRTGHAWRSVQVTNEVHDLPLIYTFGWGTPLMLHHRNIKDFDASLGDKIEIWKGGSNEWENILANTQWYDVNYQYGKVFLRGFIFSILRKHRARITYRYGDSTVPGDIKDAVIKMVATDIINTSFRMDKLPTGGSGIDIQYSLERWRDDIDKTVHDRTEIITI